MYKPTFGTKNQINFRSESEYYEFLGFLAKSDGTTMLVWEDNDLSGAWSKEGRILFFISQPSMLNVNLLHTAGVGGSILSRVNCNEFILHLKVNHRFELGESQNIEVIRTTIPTEFQDDFNRGLEL